MTTGTIDSDEPLWFDKLARSLKTTERTCIDVEIDIPRRFWLRTEAERLEANAQIFGLLRLLDDARRTEQLGRILGYLAAKDGDRRGKMLSWDQVRAMHRQGDRKSTRLNSSH